MKDIVNNFQSLVDRAYKKLKQDVYYDTVDLFLRKRVAEFESSPDFKERLGKVTSVLQSKKNNGLLREWLDEINFHILPKTVNFDDETPQEAGKDRKQVKFITNLRTREHYEVSRVNYFICAPIELHILDVLWSMVVGVKLDEKLDGFCLGNRIKKPFTGESEDSCYGLFKQFSTQYSKWRDTAIDSAEKALNDNANVLLMGMDIKECYYHLDVPWENIAGFADDALGQELTNIIRYIHDSYWQKTAPFLKKTHFPGDAKVIKGLPVGLSSSRIIANWRLSDFDLDVQHKLHPLYYGRYVDDILLVIKSPILKKATLIDGEHVVDEILVKSKLLRKRGEDKYYLEINPLLEVQSKKLTVQFFNYKHSHAGLKEFRRAIDAQASEFRFLPSGDDTRGLDDCAFDVIYKGSVNKLRSIVALEENDTELSKYLSRRIIQHRLCEDGLKAEYIEQLFRFYKGKNIFDFCRLWEKVFTLLITNNKYSKMKMFFNECQVTIKKLRHGDRITEKKIIDDMWLYLKIALSIPVGLSPSKADDLSVGLRLEGILKANSLKMRKANLIRHQYVSYPLVNYTDYEGDLINFNVDDLGPRYRNLTKIKLELTPRFVHSDEYQLFRLISTMPLYKKNCEFITGLLHDSVGKADRSGGGTVEVADKSKDGKDRPRDSICIGIANMKINDADIKKAHDPKQSPNLSFYRQAELFELLNTAIKKETCDILVLPELSIPVKWLPFMVSFARTHQIAIVFGLEYWVVGKNVHNFVFTLLPYKLDHGYRACLVSARLKNHYAPKERKEILNSGKRVIGPKSAYYEKFLWRGVNFSVYNCFELTDIQHRGLMRSKLDFLIAVAWNPDISYYSNIIEAATRDLHCYVINVNTSQFGDSRIAVPKKAHEMNVVRVKGGINTVVLKEKLKIAELRNFQTRKRYEDGLYKPQPAGYSIKDARKRAAQKIDDSFIIIERVPG